MCGIAGYVGSAPSELLPLMVRALEHRGPDDEGLHVENEVGLGMTRLAIIDLVTGRQPMATSDKTAPSCRRGGAPSTPPATPR
jgi:asparagine synthase (glutamine-hydrolysing)